MEYRKRVAVNVRFLLTNKLEGIGYFTHECLRRIVKQNPDIEFYFLFDRSYDPQFIYASNVKPVVLFPPARHPFLWFLWFEISVRFWLWRTKPDLFLSPDGYTVLNCSVPTVTVIHDLAFEHAPEQVGFLVRNYYKIFVPKFAACSTALATVSTFSKEDIIKRYNVEESKIGIVYSAAKDLFHVVGKEAQISFRAKYCDGKSYFVYVGSIHPRKNVERLLMAFDAFKRETNSDFKLVIVGRKAWSYEDVEFAYNAMQHKKDVVFTGRLNEEELNTAIASSHALFFVSLFEGFGVPVLEAMRCGVPVVTSNITSMPEVAGEAAIQVNPYDVNEICESMKNLVEHEKLRISLIERGKQQAFVYTWDDTSARLWEICKKTFS